MTRYIVIYDDMADDEVLIFNSLDKAIDSVHDYYSGYYDLNLFQFILSIDEFGNTAIEYDNESMTHYLTFDSISDEDLRYHANVL